MALGASSGMQGLRVAISARSAAVVHAASALIGDARVRTFVSCKPIISCMTGGAIEAEHSGMEDRVTMTTGTGS